MYISGTFQLMNALRTSHTGVSSLAGYIGEAMDGLPFSLAFVMVKERFVVPAIFFYLESAVNKR